MAQDVMGHAFGDAGRLGQRQDRRQEIADVRRGFAAVLTRIGPLIAAGEEPRAFGFWCFKVSKTVRIGSARGMSRSS